MKTKFLLIVLLSAATIESIYAQAPAWAWAKSAGGSTHERGYGIATDKIGNVYAIGYFSSSSILFGSTTLTNLSSGDGDVFITKYDANGNVLWAKSAGGSTDDEGTAIATDVNGNVYVTGYFYSPNITFGSFILINAGGYDVFIAKYDSSGNVLWAKSAGGTDDDKSFGIATDTSGNAFITGAFPSLTITFGSTILTNAQVPENDIFIAKYDKNGNVQWAKSAGGTSADWSYAVASDMDGNSYITGFFSSPAIVFGSTTLININQPNQNIFIAKYDANGNVIWAKNAVGGGNIGSSIATDSSNVYIGGTFSSPNLIFGTSTLINAGGSDLFIAKYDTAGSAAWGRSIGGVRNEDCNAITIDESGSIYLAGTFASPNLIIGSTTLTIDTTNTNVDILVAKYDNNGNALWGKSAAGNSSDNIYSVAIDGSGVYVSGSFASTNLTFGSTTLAHAGSLDVFVAKLSSTVGIDENYVNENLLFIYPNPSTSSFTLELSSPMQNAEVIIYDMLGNEQLRKKLTGLKTEIQRGDLAAGVYFARVNLEEKSLTQKILIQ